MLICRHYHLKMSPSTCQLSVLFHDTFYVIGHFHVMLAGSGMIGIFSAYYFYFPAMYGVRYSRIYAYVHYIYYVIGQLMITLPML